MTVSNITERSVERNVVPSAVEPSRREAIRLLSEKDLDQVVDLYRRLFGISTEDLPAYLKKIFFETPWDHGSGSSSLAYEDADGRVVACLGIMPRPMKFHGRDLRAAVAHHLMVDPTNRGRLAGLSLARDFLRGPQDLSLTEGNDSLRRIWEFLGGNVGLLYSLSWTRALRPAQYTLGFFKRRGLSAPAAMTLHPVCRALDATLHVAPPEGLRFQRPDALSDELDAVTLYAAMSIFSSGRQLAPVYDIPSIAWMLGVLAKKPNRGSLQKVAVRTRSGRLLGWYLYYLTASRVAEVVQIGAREETMGEVLNHLFFHAWQRGAVAASGRLDPRHCDLLSRNHCVLHRSDNCWMLIHSRDPQILNTINAGEAVLGRLEAEWWIAS